VVFNTHRVFGNFAYDTISFTNNGFYPKLDTKAS